MLLIPLIILLIPVILVLISIKQVNQYERGVKFRLGKYVGIMNPGWKIVWPVIEGWQRIDIRVKAVDVPEQAAITKDNISAGVNAVIYYKVRDASKAVLEVEDYFHAVSQLAQTTMRNVVGETNLDDLLSQRKEVAANIKSIIDKATDAWGITVEAVELKDIILPENMKRVIARQAEAERERRAIVIRAEGEKEAAENISTAAAKLSKSGGGLHIRTLQTLAELAGDKSNTVVFVTPLEILKGFEGIIKDFKK